MVQYSTTTLSSSRVPDSMNSALPVVGCEAAAACLVKFWRQKLSLYSRVCTLVSVEREGDMALPEWWVSGTQWLGSSLISKLKFHWAVFPHLLILVNLQFLDAKATLE